MEPLDLFRKGWNTDGPEIESSLTLNYLLNENSTLATLILKQTALILYLFLLENIHIFL